MDNIIRFDKWAEKNKAEFLAKYTKKVPVKEEKEAMEGMECWAVDEHVKTCGKHENIQCDHQCTGNCRRVGCNCECGEWHNSKE